jgi:cytochrome c oxidase subunit III
MSLTVGYGALLAAVIVWLILVRKLSARSWEAQPATGAADSEDVVPPAKRIGLWVFLGVVTSLFALFISAYSIRMGNGHGLVNDWRPLTEPTVLWLNTVLLIASSISMQWARAAVSRGEVARTRDGLLLGGLLTMGFLAGQLFAWRQVQDSGLLQWSDPATAFFYLLTAVHGLHLIGGLFVWGKAITRFRPTTEAIEVRLSVELCTLYWHYLLLVWLVLFGLLLST